MKKEVEKLRLKRFVKVEYLFKSKGDTGETMLLQPLGREFRRWPDDTHGCLYTKESDLSCPNLHAARRGGLPRGSRL